jgi:hypothetical protein
MTAGVNYLALYMIKSHLSEYLGVEDSEKEDRKGVRRSVGVNYLALYTIPAHLSEYLGVEDSEEEDRKGEGD